MCNYEGDQLQIEDDAEEHQKTTIPRLNNNESNKYIGIISTPNGDSTHQYKSLQKNATSLYTLSVKHR